MGKENYSEWSEKELIREIKKLKKRKKYGVVWEDKPEEVAQLCKENLPVLKEDKTKEIETDESNPTNILIEGDNYHALSVLNYTHKRKIDVIYIDPPYNTGAKDWKYNNNYVDENDAWRHSKWLSFMNNRLRLAKRLLSPKGVLICAVDHNEQEALGLLLEEIFPSHTITCITIIHNPGGIQGDNFSYTHEYAYFVFPSNGVYIGRVQRDKANIVPLRDWGGDESKRETAKNSFYPIYVKGDEIIGFGDVPSKDFHPSAANIERDDGTLEIWPIDKDGVERKWRHAKQSVEKIKGQLKCEEVKGEKVIRRYKSEYRYKTVWTDKKFNSNAYGSNLLNKIIDKKFPFPKSLYNVKECLDAVALNNPNAIILDYFAGSGTTGHAVLEMNRLDNGNRKFILCSNNEGDICDEICYVRIKKVIEGYEFKGKDRQLLFDKKLTFSQLKNISKINEKIEKIKEENKDKFAKFESKLEDNTITIYGVSNSKGRREGLGGNLRYFKTDFVDAEPTDINKKRLVDKSTEMLCLKEDCFDKVRSVKYFKIFKNNKGKHLGIIYDDEGIEPFKKEVKKSNKKFSVYVFSLDESAREEEFEDVADFVNLKPIPEVILNVYRRIFK